ncbi:GDP-mannose 4,6-dehydratase [Nocardioides baekrokdamisoli]|uniref:GDP-mannose 4,6-dehydratase n=1 Tax=Nocardioides baekrokdamisoli TaxID=1804624 RepID=A0A3G9IYV8_9ACTN|nr:GDP-mannose 4,6-dehydratase [Nocardioides baekrokdamisoli]BBH16374.1 GDP-mannose 4,6-dehydratase [Nocardioides baekrokdamisoli]
MHEPQVETQDAPGPVLITGVTGQDGMLLARALVDEGRTVIGTARPGTPGLARMAPYLEGVEIVSHDVADVAGFAHLLHRHRPAEVYNLAAFSAVRASWGDPERVFSSNAAAVAGMLEAMVRFRDVTGIEVRLFQASTAEVYGDRTEGRLDESTPHQPRTPYAAAKSAAHQLVVCYREHYGLFACNGIMFNHESPFRGQKFIAGRIARVAALAARGEHETVTLGDMDVHRDWGAAVDYVRAARLMLAHDIADDYVVATGTTHTVRDLLNAAFAAVGRDDALDHVRMDHTMWSTTQARWLRGDPSRAQQRLGWSTTTSFEELVAQLVNVDLQRLESGVEESLAFLADAGAR